MSLKILHSKINKIIEIEKVKTIKSYNMVTPYQSYERIKYKGLRWSVEKRLKYLNFNKFINKSSDVLDIGSNFGFFICEIAHKCKSADGVEINPYLNKIGNVVSDYLNLKNTNFFSSSFIDFAKVNNKKYDVVLSQASFYTEDKKERTDANKYVNQVIKILNKNGYFFYESTSYNKKDVNHKKNIKAKDEIINVLSKKMKKIKEWEGRSGSKNFYRYFFISQKI